MKNYKQLIKQIIQSEELIKLVFSDKRSKTSDLRKVIVRPVLIRGKKLFQFSFFDSKKDISTNYQLKVIDYELNKVYRFQFININIETKSKMITIQINERNKIKISEVYKSIPTSKINLNHNREKSYILPIDSPFFKEIGISTNNGRIKADKYKKFQQINEFLKIIRDSIGKNSITAEFNIVDFGCGNAQLTFSIYYYLNYVLNTRSTIIGVDIKEDLIQKHNKLAKELNWSGIEFINSKIIEFNTKVKPNIVIALHACDTATDETIAQAINWNSKYIFVAPCCHHNLQSQMNQKLPPNMMQLFYKYGILKERLGDILTDTFRATILRTYGYETDIVQFTSIEHTSKNLLIKAVKNEETLGKGAVNDYIELKKFWGLKPYLEKLINKTE